MKCTQIEKYRHTLILEPLSKRINVVNGSLIYKAILALNFPISALCAGNGKCGKCIIQILDFNPKISKPTEKEIKILGRDNLIEGYRLACQTKIFGDLRVYLTNSLIPKGARIVVNSDLKSLGIHDINKIQPIVVSKEYKVETADLTGPKNDLSRLEDIIIEQSNDFRIFKNP
ncbi:MAG: 2Fe-2S iron-sulfur cluster-binding protein, partial [Candidatus Hodarchaeota archaeon]